MKLFSSVYAFIRRLGQATWECHMTFENKMVDVQKSALGYERILYGFHWKTRAPFPMKLYFSVL